MRCEKSAIQSASRYPLLAPTLTSVAFPTIRRSLGDQRCESGATASSQCGVTAGHEIEMKGATSGASHDEHFGADSRGPPQASESMM